MMKKSIAIPSLICFIFVMLAASVSFAAQPGAKPGLLNPPVVQAKGGKLRGYMNDEIFVFAGIKYATSERFGLPRPVEPWEGVVSAQTYGPIAPIARMTKVGDDEFVWPHRYWPQDENCQYLNVWTQKLDPNAKKPVMVFFHGGGYTNGSAIEAWAYDGTNLSRYGDVVVVTVNHRLNVLGYLDLSAYGDAYKYSPHVGWADLVLSLEWVRDNVAAFGGDPENVTIFGQSGGGGKVITLMHMPSAKGLFSKAISQSSGSGVNYGKTTKAMARKIASLTFKNLNIKEGDVDALKKVSYDALIEAADQAIAQARKDDPANAAYINWNPIPGDDYVLNEYCDWTKNMPFMTGSVFSEQIPTFRRGDGRKNEWSAEETRANLKKYFGDKADAVANEFARVFPNKKVADACFYSSNGRNNSQKVASLLRAAGVGPVYEYLFTYELPVNGGTTAFHCVELTYIFHNVSIPILSIATGGAEESYKLQDVVATAWLNFARTGNPSQPGLEWKPYTDAGKETMIFDATSELRSFDDAKLRELMPLQ
ncbi:MAG: carboxylesterase family protein [Synergistaceae bacterium]|jgi:para-nitrobenzyl esterase|nr:carboxylesterase family protein [Synergistaceae bacterium]